MPRGISSIPFCLTSPELHSFADLRIARFVIAPNTNNRSIQPKSFHPRARDLALPRCFKSKPYFTKTRRPIKCDFRSNVNRNGYRRHNLIEVVAPHRYCIWVRACSVASSSASAPTGRPVAPRIQRSGAMLPCLAMRSNSGPIFPAFSICCSIWMAIMCPIG